MNTQSRGHREREARKRQKRTLYWNTGMEAGSLMLKLGHKHLQRSMRSALGRVDFHGRDRKAQGS
jgi:hypothetical protein